MINCFANNDIFLLNFWHGIEYVSNNLKENRKEVFSNRLSSAVYLASVIEKMDQNLKNPSYFHSDFCKLVLQNKHKIKLQALFYANRLIELLYETPQQTLIPSRINILDFFLNFLQNTFFETVILKCCKMIKEWKKKWPALWNNSFFDDAVEESENFLKNSETFTKINFYFFSSFAKT